MLLFLMNAYYVFLVGSSTTFTLLVWCLPAQAQRVVGPGGLVLRHDRPAAESGTSFVLEGAAHGFVVDGSSIVGVNGIYGPRQNADSPDLPSFRARIGVGAYRHDSSGWWLVHFRAPLGHEVAEFEGDPDAESDASRRNSFRFSEEDQRFHRSDEGEGDPLSPDAEWVFIDPDRRETFGHAGDAYIPGVGKHWVQLHRPPPADSSGATEGGGGGGCGADSSGGDGDDDGEKASREESREERRGEAVSPDSSAGTGLVAAHEPLPPTLIAPIPSDPDSKPGERDGAAPNADADGRPSFHFEQLLVQFRRQAAKEAAARRYTFSALARTH